MADSSFDIEATVDRQEVDNALNQAYREVSQRFDFKGTDTELAWEGDEAIRIVSASEDRSRAALDVLKDKLVKRKVSLKGIDVSDPKDVSGGRSRIDVALRTEMPADIAKQIVKQIKASKLKVTPTNMGDKIRVSGKKRDDLQQVMTLIKGEDYDAPIVFTNYS
jgi:uncharacterized protein YajQ (UPF0234 family)